MIDFIGNEQAVAWINKALQLTRLPSAFIFAGPEGVGKKVLAVELAKCLNCLQREQPDKAHSVFDACQSCISCKKISKGVHPDIQIINPEENYIRIDQMRRLRNEAQFCPFEGKERIFIIDEAERMNLEASNSILKTLEEPPEHVRLVLITSNLNALVPTIRSRCRIIRFNSVTIGGMVDQLVSKGRFSKEDAEIAAKLSQGNIGQALGMDLQEYRKLRKEVFLAIKSIIKAKDLLYASQVAQTVSRDKKVTENWLKLIFCLLRDLLILKFTKEANLLVNRDIVTSLENISSGVNLDGLFASIESILEAQRAIEMNANRQITWEVLFINLAQHCAIPLYE